MHETPHNAPSGCSLIEQAIGKIGEGLFQKGSYAGSDRGRPTHDHRH